VNNRGPRAQNPQIAPDALYLYGHTAAIAASAWFASSTDCWKTDDVLSNTLLTASMLRYAAASLRAESRSALFSAGLFAAASSIPAALVSEIRAIALSAEFVSAFTEWAASWYAEQRSFFALATCSGVKVGEGDAVVEALPEALDVGRVRSMMPTTSAATAIRPITTSAIAMRPLDPCLLGASGGGVHCTGGGGWGFIT
jgi:hypothetical protein